MSYELDDHWSTRIIVPPREITYVPVKTVIDKYAINEDAASIFARHLYRLKDDSPVDVIPIDPKNVVGEMQIDGCDVIQFMELFTKWAPRHYAALAEAAEKTAETE